MQVSPTSYLASKAILGFVGFVGGQVFANCCRCARVQGLLLGIVFAIVSFMLPGRPDPEDADAQGVLRAELPDALDLLAVSVEAGLGFDGAISKLTEHMDSPLAGGSSSLEMRIGESRLNALTKMMKRVDTPELSAFVRAIIQADQLGISLGRILGAGRGHAQPTPARRRGAGDEGTDQDAVPDGHLHLPGHVHRHPRVAFMNLSELF